MKTKRMWKDHWTSAVAPPPGAPLVMTDAGHGVGWGVLRRSLGANVHNDLREFFWQKLTHGRGPDHVADWHPTATHQVLLPADAPSDLLDAKRLAERYEDDAFVGIKDLACVAKITISKTDRILITWPKVLAFAAAEFCQKRNMAVLAVLHVPARSGVKREAHVHLVAPARELDKDGFGAFLRPFASDAGGPEIARAWASWL